MELKDYSTQELKDELKRRAIETRKRVALERKAKGTQYAYAEALVEWVSDEPFMRRKFWVEPLKPVDKYASRTLHPSLDKRIFNSKNCPQKGDIVKLKSRKTKMNPEGFGFSKSFIIEIVKRKSSNQ